MTNFENRAGISEMYSHYDEMLEITGGSMLDQAKILIEFAEELEQQERFQEALDCLRRSRRKVEKTEDFGYLEALQTVVNSHYSRVCKAFYGEDESVWPIYERSYLASTGQRDS